MLVIIPAGVVHAYQNLGPGPGWVFNCPNRLFKGPGRKEPVDEVRHEADPESPFRV
jgi:dTDP-4-dehydrorhamnose 3,5-epimerase